MALSFKNTKGSAVSTKIAQYKYKDGENTVRLVGGVLPRYLYWLKGSKSDIPVECLAFDRNLEKFTGATRDPVQEKFPEAKCSWAYSVNCIDPTDGTVKVLSLKKKLFQQIMDAAESLGDPTDEEEGWDVTFKRAKNGPNAFNVEYTLQVLKCKKRALTEAERKLVAEAKTIDEKYPVPTVEEIEAQLTRLSEPDSEDEASEGASEAAKDI